LKLGQVRGKNREATGFPPIEPFPHQESVRIGHARTAAPESVAKIIERFYS